MALSSNSWVTFSIPSTRPTSSLLYANLTSTALNDTGIATTWRGFPVSSQYTNLLPSGCTALIAPAFQTWTVDNNYPPIGTTYIYVNPAANTTSTSVTREPSILEEVKTSKFSQLGGWYGASPNADCKIEAEYAPRLGYNTSWGPPVATWPGPTTLFEVGGILSMNRVNSLGTFMTWSTTLPNLIWYTKDDQWWETYSLYDPAQDKIFTTSMLHMPDLSNLLADITDLKTCQRIFWMTTPSTLTYANFLTEYRTIPASAPVGVVTPGPGAPAAPVPGLTVPTVAPTPLQPGGLPANNANDPPTVPKQTADPRSGSSSNSGDGSNPGAGIPNPSPPQPTTITHLILPGAASAVGQSQTLLPGAAPITVSNRAFYLDRGGMVHIAPVATLMPGVGLVDNDGSRTGSDGVERAGIGSGQGSEAITGVRVVDQSRATMVPLSVLERSGRVDALGVDLGIGVGRSVEVAGGGEAGPEHASGGGNGGVVGSQGAGQGRSQDGVEGGSIGASGSAGASRDGTGAEIGKMISDIGKWIAAGLGGGMAGSEVSWSADRVSPSPGFETEGTTGGGFLPQNGGIARTGANGRGIGGSRNGSVVPFTGDAVGKCIRALALTTSLAANASWSNLTVTTPTITSSDPRTCFVVLNPVYATWVPAPDNGTVGTSYLYVDADVGTTSTSVTCNQSAFADQFSSRWSKSRYYYTETMDSNCNQVWPIVNAPHWLWDSSQSYLQSATWPGPSTMLDIGHMIAFAGGEGLIPMQTLPTPIYYTDKELTRLTALPTDDPLYYLQDKNLFLMPKFSNYFPNNTAFKTCTRFLWETSPNTLTYANFLTQTITVHSTPAGTLTTMPLPQPTHVPGQGPSVAMPTPTKLAGAPGGPIWPGSSQGSGEQGSSSGAGAGSGGGTGSGGSGASSGSGSNSGGSGSGSSGSNGNSRSNGSSGSNGNSDLNNPNSKSNDPNPGAANNIDPAAAAAGTDNSPPTPTNPPSLILAGSQTLRPGASPLTISSLLVSLDQAGMVHITSVGSGVDAAGQPGPTPALGGGGSYPGSLGGSGGSGGSGPFGSHGASGGSGRNGGIGAASDGFRTMIVPVSIIAQFGGLDAFGVSIKVAVEGETGQGGTWSGGVGGGVESGLGGADTEKGGEGIGQRVAEMGRWIAAGLGGEAGLGWLTAGAAVGGGDGASGEGRKSGGGSQETGSGGSAGGSGGGAGSGGGGRGSAERNGSVVAFTGGAGRIDGHSCRGGSMGLVAGCMGTALLLL
ncbi:THO complex subunit 2 [Elsinoe australis]|uniref:THO complex subunit 2 n=1 Tax=Elsinoe australis TaxID=40998 RepID=A0A2P7YE04_9PEZI|nr:THO complex subunit 2 [Elsinoe australis]